VYLNWNELNAARAVNKQWQTLVASDPGLQAGSGVITINKNLVETFKIFNGSGVIWTSFRITVNTVFDLTQPVQSEFWWKHGPTMRSLEIRNSKDSIFHSLLQVSHCSSAYSSSYKVSLIPNLNNL
jgi:hypothetical protein